MKKFQKLAGAKTLDKAAQKEINGGNSNYCRGGWCPSTGNCQPCFMEDPVGQSEKILEKVVVYYVLLLFFMK